MTLNLKIISWEFYDHVLLMLVQLQVLMATKERKRQPNSVKKFENL